jgi:hypothetical protein
MGMAEAQKQITKRILKEIKEKGGKIIVTDPLKEFKKINERG